MGSHHRRSLTLLSLLGLWWLAAGCASLQPPAYRAYLAPYRAHPELTARARTIKAPAVVPPNIKLYSLSAGGVEELRDDWSAAGRDNVLKGIQESLKRQPVNLKSPAPDRDTLETLEEVQALFRVVSQSILERTYSSYPFLTKVEHFDYSIGPIDKILQKYRADALILTYGFDQISTGGRKALQTVGAILPFVGGPSSGATGLSVALVDRSGTILWYKIDGDRGGHDLRDPRSASKFVTAMLSDFPRLGQ